MKKLIVFLVSAIAAPAVMGQGLVLFQDYGSPDVFSGGALDGQATGDTVMNYLWWASDEGLGDLQRVEGSEVASISFEGAGTGLFSAGQVAIQGADSGVTVWLVQQSIGEGYEGLGMAHEVKLGGGALPVPAMPTEVVTLLVPEPTSFALAGLGAAALMIFRRRK